MHLELFAAGAADWLDPELAERWSKIRRVRRVVTGALELERAASASAPRWKPRRRSIIADPDLLAALSGLDLAEISITSDIAIEPARGRPRPSASPTCRASRSCRVARRGVKCARSWKYFDPATADPAYPAGDAARRQGAARVGQGAPMTPARRLGLATVLIVFLSDQA